VAERPIPVADPGAQYRSVRGQIDEAISRVTASGWYILGTEVEAFEREFAAFHSMPYCTGVASGTDALLLALRATGIQPGDEVITVSHSAVATVAAIEMSGARPVFADIDPVTRCMDPASAEAMISENTAAILPVHIYGHPAGMDRIMTIARRHMLKVVEDCAQAHGAAIDGRRVGTFGDAAAFSFYPTKNLGAIGDGGAVVTRHADIHERIRSFRQYGWKKRHVSEVPGINSRLDELQAAVLRVKLPRLLEDNERRRAIASRYSEVLRKSDMQVPVVVAGIRHAMHLYVVETERREAFESFMKRNGVATARHYPMAIHQQPAYAGRCRGSDLLPVTEKLYTRMVTLPLYPELTPPQVDRICDALNAWTRR